MALAVSLKKPFVKEYHRSAAKWLKPGAAPKYGNVRHGLDAQGAIHVVVDPSFGAKEMNEKEGAWTYLLYGDGQIQAVAFQSTPGRLRGVQLCVYDGDRLIRQHAIGSGQASESHYFWEGGRLDRELSIGWYVSRSRKPAEAMSHTETRFHYDELGRLERIVERSLNEDGTVYERLGPRLLYERPRKEETIPQLSGEIERTLLQQVPALAAKAKGKGPFYCLLLCYCGEDFPAGWPPFLLLGCESERERIIQRGQDVKSYLWAVGEMEDKKGNVRLTLEDEVLDKACRLHIQLMEARHPDNPPTQQRKTMRPRTRCFVTWPRPSMTLIGPRSSK
jgi:hypothetical protein